jgi:methyl-accepting chemotaxis protein
MDSDSLPRVDELRTRFSVQLVAVGLAMPLVSVVYLALLAELTASDWTKVIVAMTLVAVLAPASIAIWSQRRLAPLLKWLDERDLGDVSTSLTTQAFCVAIGFPADTQRAAMVVSVSSAIAVNVVLAVAVGTELSLGISGFAILLGGATAGFLTGVFHYGVSRRGLDSILRHLVTVIPDPEERMNHIRSASLLHRFAFTTVATVACTLIFALTFAHVQSDRALYNVSLKWQETVLQAVVSKMNPAGFDDAVRSVVGDRTTLPYPVEFKILTNDHSSANTSAQNLIPQEVRARVVAGQTSGRIVLPSQDVLLVFRSLADGRIASAQVRRSAVLSGAASWLPTLVIVLLVASVAAMMVMKVISSDLLRSVSSLRETAVVMASGDLRRGRISDADDEVGELWRALESLSDGFRTTVVGLSNSADRFDSAAGQIVNDADGVTGASEYQVGRIQQASELIVSINSQVMEVADAAQNLNISVEDSSSSILELGAAGDELNETASLLGGKVDEVSSSIEQMVRSVKQVSASSDGLADAAAETSASMEEMASAMRAVDTTAELTANLSRNVVESAELGQAKVSQTIDGMQAIQDATDTAEKVIRGLGARTQEIGAILDVIDDVAEETNLLALNAAIIAAQAGEHGRAFSVVAEEIKELADRVLASTKEIGSLIRAVQDESDNAVGAIEVGSRSVASGVELSAEAGLSLEEITSSSRESGQRIAEIVSAVREQTKAASHVVGLMDAVRDGVTAIVSAAADQDRGNEVVYQLSVTMREVTQQVRRTTEEQSRGFGRISGSIESVRGVVENVNDSLTEQSTACGQVADFLGEVDERTRANKEFAMSMGGSIRDLVSETEALRENVAKFKV